MYIGKFKVGKCIIKMKCLLVSSVGQRKILCPNQDGTEPSLPDNHNYLCIFIIALKHASQLKHIVDTVAFIDTCSQEVNLGTFMLQNHRGLFGAWDLRISRQTHWPVGKWPSQPRSQGSPGSEVVAFHGRIRKSATYLQRKRSKKGVCARSLLTDSGKTNNNLARVGVMIFLARVWWSS